MQHRHTATTLAGLRAIRLIPLKLYNNHVFLFGAMRNSMLVRQIRTFNNEIAYTMGYAGST